MHTYLIAYESIDNTKIIAKEIIAETMEQAVEIFDAIFLAKEYIIAITEKNW